MAIFAIFRRPGDAEDQAVFVPEGFSSRALVFTLGWTLWHRMWVVSAIVLALMAAIALLPFWIEIGDIIPSLLSAAIAALLGFEGQNLRAWSLRKAGYAEEGLVEAEKLETAELKYFWQTRGLHSASSSVVAVPSYSSSQADPLGLFGNV